MYRHSIHIYRYIRAQRHVLFFPPVGVLVLGETGLAVMVGPALLSTCDVCACAYVGVVCVCVCVCVLLPAYMYVLV
jgi:hypothetical protein